MKYHASVPSSASRRLRELLIDTEIPVPVSEICRQLAGDLSADGELESVVTDWLLHDDAFLVFHDHRRRLVCLPTDPDELPVRRLECRVIPQPAVTIPIVLAPSANQIVAALAA